METANVSTPADDIARQVLLDLQSRLKKREDSYRVAAAEAIRAGNDSKAELLLPRIRELAEIRRELNPPVPGIQIAQTRTPVLAAFAATEQTCRGLVVTLNGQSICRRTDAATFADAIYAIGCEKVASLNLKVNHLPLVAKERRRLPHQHYSMQIEQRGGWFIITHSSTQRKIELLDRIKRQLHIDLTAR